MHLRTVNAERLEELDRLMLSPTSAVVGCVAESLRKEINHAERVEFHRSNPGDRNPIARLAATVELVIPQDIATYGSLD